MTNERKRMYGLQRTKARFPLYQEGARTRFSSSPPLWGGFRWGLFSSSSAQFMQADNYIQTPEDYIGYNGYAYCRYNPFKYTDPSGEVVTYMLDINPNDHGFFAYNPATTSPNAMENVYEYMTIKYLTDPITKKTKKSTSYGKGTKQEIENKKAQAKGGRGTSLALNASSWAWGAGMSVLRLIPNEHFAKVMLKSSTYFSIGVALYDSYLIGSEYNGDNIGSTVYGITTTAGFCTLSNLFPVVGIPASLAYWVGDELCKQNMNGASIVQISCFGQYGEVPTPWLRK